MSQQSKNNIVLSIFGTRPGAIKMAPVVKALEQAEGILANEAPYGKCPKAHNPYGDGQAAGRIVERIRQFI